MYIEVNCLSDPKRWERALVSWGTEIQISPLPIIFVQTFP